MTEGQIALIIISELLLLGAFVALSRRGSKADPRLGEQLRGVEQALTGQLTAVTADLAARVEKVRSELAHDQTKALGATLAELTATINRELQAGRSEQGATLVQVTRQLEAKFLGLGQQTAQQLEGIRGAVDGKLQEISGQVQNRLDQNIREGFAHFNKIQEHLKAAEEQLRGVGVLGESVNELNALLKLPHLRGKFGELTLGQLLNNFLPAALYELQAVVVPGSTERVDALVRFPGAALPIDSKFPREQVLPLFATSDPKALEAARKKLGTVIKAQAQEIRDKYIHPEHGTTDLALLYLPSETLYFEVIRDGELEARLHELKVFPVSPNTLAVTLAAIAQSHQQYRFAKGVEQSIARLRLAQRHLENFQERFDEVGIKLDEVQDAYGRAESHLRHYTTRVTGLTGGDGLPESAVVSPPTVPA